MKFSFITLYVKDMEKSLACYRDTIGLAVLSRNATEDGELAFLGIEGEPNIELIMSPTFAQNSYKGFSVGFEVESLEASTAVMEAAGYARLRGPIMPHPGAVFSFFDGPNGEEIQLIEHR